MAKMKAADLVPIYNNIAKRKGVPQLPFDTKLTIHEMGDKLEWVNGLKEPGHQEQVFFDEEVPKPGFMDFVKFLFFSRNGC